MITARIPAFLDAGDLLQGAVEAAGFAEPIVSLPQTVQGQLILLTAAFLQPPAYLVIQMEGIAQDGEWDAMFLHQSQQIPEVRVQDGVAASDVEVGQAAVDLAEVQAIVKGVPHLGPGHGVQLLAGVLCKNVAVLAPLIALVGDVPLKGEIFHFKFPPDCLSFERGRISQTTEPIPSLGKCAPAGCPAGARALTAYRQRRRRFRRRWAWAQRACPQRRRRSHRRKRP